MIIMFAAVYPKDSPLWVVWLTLFISLGFGSGIGYAAAKWARVGVLFVGAWIGGLLGGLLYTLVFYIFSQNNPLLGVWLSIAIPSLIIAIASMIYFDQAIIIGSAIGGAYVFARVSVINIWCYCRVYHNLQVAIRMSSYFIKNTRIVNSVKYLLPSTRTCQWW